ncbi:hypothetical protein [Lacisediminimonas profundi]|uniref:hypothetical protein n=1 Tax=Lacisediminimonas profundi TaxID=2603856 RepID=UPI00124AE53D|nr:hypothetical protein [Lacisediminimonas profundi]
MLLARWQIDAHFGQKQKVIEKLREWETRIAPQLGIRPGRILTGSIGALEATVVHEWEVADLGEIERAWAKLPNIPAHQQWSDELEPYVVSGTSRWEIFRIL